MRWWASWRFGASVVVALFFIAVLRFLFFQQMITGFIITQCLLLGSPQSLHLCAESDFITLQWLKCVQSVELHVGLIFCDYTLCQWDIPRVVMIMLPQEMIHNTEFMSTMSDFVFKNRVEILKIMTCLCKHCNPCRILKCIQGQSIMVFKLVSV